MSSRERNEQKRREREEKEHQWCLDREEELARQDACSHYDCAVTRFNWQGKPAEVTCQECGAVNHIEENH